MQPSDIDYQINPNAKIQVGLVGHEQTPVLIVDDFCLDLSDLKKYACDYAAFTPVKSSMYPGVRATLPECIGKATLAPLYKMLYEVYHIPTNYILKPRDLFFSIVSFAEKELSLMQRIPHFDTPNPYYFAVMLYINEGEHGGTAIYRHKPTSFERISNAKVDKYFDSAEEFIKQHGEPEDEYIRSSNEHYELIQEIAYKPNRLVIYPGNLLHSGMIIPEHDIDPNPKTGRLTTTVFVEFD